MAALEQGVPSTNAPLPWLRDALGTARSPRARRAARGLTVGLAAWEISRKAYQWGRGRATYTVAVPATDELYEPLLEWFTDEVRPRSRRAVTVRTRRAATASGSDSPAPPTPAQVYDPIPVAAPTMLTGFDGETAHVVRLGGHRVTVKVDRKSSFGEGLSLTVNSHDEGWSRSMTKLTFTCYGEGARDAVLKFLRGLSETVLAGETVRPRMWIGTRWGEWSRVRELAPRTLDSVILPDAQRDRIVADLARFLASEALYARVGVPWHHGLLFYGTPGCGKTSLAGALASHFGLDVHLVTLSDLDGDDRLVQLLGTVDPRSVLILEDIDVVSAATDRDDNRKGATLSGLLNALDGMATPHGLITIMTTNDLDALDPALIRPGRADLIEEFLPLDNRQARRMVELVIDSPCPSDFPDAGRGLLTHAELLDAAKPYLDDPDRAVAAMADRVRSYHGSGPLAAVRNAPRTVASNGVASS